MTDTAKRQILAQLGYNEEVITETLRIEADGDATIDWQGLAEDARAEG